jgi:hypothetical protein
MVLDGGGRSLVVQCSEWRGVWRELGSVLSCCHIGRWVQKWVYETFEAAAR